MTTIGKISQLTDNAPATRRAPGADIHPNVKGVPASRVAAIRALKELVLAFTKSGDDAAADVLWDALLKIGRLPS